MNRLKIILFKAILLPIKHEVSLRFFINNVYFLIILLHDLCNDSANFIIHIVFSFIIIIEFMTLFSILQSKKKLNNYENDSFHADQN